MRTSLLIDQHHQIMLLLPWYLNLSLEHNELQRVESFLQNSFLGSGLTPILEKYGFSSYASKLSIWVCGVSDPDKRFDSEDWLSCAFSMLEPDQRLIIGLTFFQGRSYQDIAKILNCSEETVKSCMLHARKKLQAFVYNQEN
jgi:RNA polymerase sigma factor (sigma-70 family)